MTMPGTAHLTLSRPQTPSRPGDARTINNNILRLRDILDRQEVARRPRPRPHPQPRPSPCLFPANPTTTARARRSLFRTRTSARRAPRAPPPRICTRTRTRTRRTLTHRRSPARRKTAGRSCKKRAWTGLDPHWTTGPSSRLSRSRRGCCCRSARAMETGMMTMTMVARPALTRLKISVLRCLLICLWCPRPGRVLLSFDRMQRRSRMVRSAFLAFFFSSCTYPHAYIHVYVSLVDPLCLLRRLEGQHGRAESSSSQHSRSSSPHYGEPSEKLKREKSFKANRHDKFIECLSREDVNMGSSFLFSFPFHQSCTRAGSSDFLDFFFSFFFKVSCKSWPGRGSRKLFAH